MSHSLSEEAQINQSHVSDADFLDEGEMREESSSLTSAHFLEEQSSRIGTSEQESLLSESECVSTIVPKALQSSSPVQTLHTGDKTEQESIKVGDPDNVFIDTSLESVSQVAFGDQPKHLSEDFDVGNDRLSTGSFVTCYSTDNVEKSNPESDFSNLEDSTITVKTQAIKGQKEPPTMESSPEDHEAHLLNTVVSSTELLDITEGDTNITEKGCTEVITQLHKSRSNKNTTSSITDWTLTLDSNPSVSSSKLVKMVLYVHNVNGLVLSLIAENGFKYIKESIQDVVSVYPIYSTQHSCIWQDILYFFHVRGRT